MKKLLSLVVLVIAGCYGRGTDEGALFAIPADIDRPSRVDFNFLKASILESKCLRCHVWAASEIEMRSMNRVVPGKPEASSLYLRVEDRSMPMGMPALSGEELQVVRDYINALAQPEPTPKPEPTPQPTPHPQKVTFEMLKKKVLVPHCIQCHRTMDQPDGIALDIEPGKPEQSILYLSVKTGSMPKDKPPLTPDELETVRRYIEDLVEPMPPPAPVPPPVPVFQMIREKLLQPSCLGCHGGTNPRREKLVEYEEVVNFAQEIRNYLEQGTMPPARATSVPRPSPETVGLYIRWLEGGMPR
jgi:mono/diheme cytochrome c family protein